VQKIASTPLTGGQAHQVPAILIAGLVAGLLDLLFVSALWWPSGVSPVAILQVIASGMIGAKAFDGGLVSAGFGAMLHFILTVAMAAIYILCAPNALRRNPWIGGTIYGAMIWAVMNLVVVPLSAAPVGPPPTLVAIADFVGHLMFVGLPIAFFARRSDRRNARL